MRPRVLAGSAATSLLALLLGCGGYHAAQSVGRAKGRATVRVKWPTGTTRLIPASAQSLIVIVAKGGTTVGTVKIVRPNASATLTGLPYGVLAVTIKAYATADGTGVAQAIGAGTMDVEDGVPGTVSVAPNSTVTALNLPSPLAFIRGGTATVTVSATDTSGAIVPLATSAGAETLTWSLTPASVASVTGTGPTVVLTGLTEGDATLAATLRIKDDGTTVSSPATPIHVSVPLAAAGLASPGWPVAGGDYGASGQGHGPAAGGTVGTAFTVGETTIKNGVSVNGTSVVTGPDGTLYAASNLKLMAQSASGATLWSVDTGHIVVGLTLTASGTLLVTGVTGIEARRADTGALLWNNALSDVSGIGGIFISSPAVGRDGRVFVATYSTLYALDGATGAALWTATNTYAIGRLAIGADGTIFGHSGSRIEARDPATGSKLWSKTTYLSDNLTSDLSASGGTVYIMSGKSSTTPSRATGRLDGAASTMESEAAYRSATPLDENGMPLVPGGRLIGITTGNTNSSTGTNVTNNGSTSGGGPTYRTYYTYWSVVALNASDGSLKWAYDLPGSTDTATSPSVSLIRSAPAVDGGRVIAQVQGCTVGLDAATGAKLWLRGSLLAYNGQSLAQLGISLAVDGTAYVPQYDGTVKGTAIQAVDPASGAVLWSAPLGGTAYGFPTVADDGTVYVGTNDGRVVPIR